MNRDISGSGVLRVGGAEFPVRYEITFTERGGVRDAHGALFAEQGHFGQLINLGTDYDLDIGGGQHIPLVPKTFRLDHVFVLLNGEPTIGR